MAEKAAAYSASKMADGGTVVTWEALAAAADVGAPVPVGPNTSLCVQLSGTLGTTPNVFIEGSNDGVNWGTLSSVAGVALSAINTLTALHQIAILPLFIRPRLSATGGGTSIDVILVMRRSPPSRS